MYKLVGHLGKQPKTDFHRKTAFQALCSFLALAAAAPLEDTAEVAAAKEAFNAAFAAAEAGEHAALRPDALHPVNNDVQAAQIAASYLDDVEDVAAAKAAFQAAFDDAAAGGLAAKQAPAPVHVVPEPAPLVAAPVAAPVVAAAPVVTYAGLHHAAYPYAVNHLGYAGINHLGYAGYPYHAGVVGYPYAGFPLVAAAPAAEE